jgi:hypothetical protein
MSKITVLGYRKGFAYYLVGNDVFRGDYVDGPESARWYAKKEAMVIERKAYGPLYDENGEEIKEENRCTGL